MALDPTSDSFNPWHLKPWWCQPWSIVLTGTGLIGGSWLLFHRVWLTGLVAIPLGVWMGFFVLVWPRLMRQYVAESAVQADLGTTQSPD
ncbi:DUF6737 family protein [Leptolyngbya sp. CCY15150]|uniref:DUF6737 family protein n=1 Tax=Leptolyngbya sp. CCY15150 TaxID=2767772 RepID=UPI00195221E9|nr:DUF6737 family protein [Leptolyngbya sp. CCY15150]